ncbi:uncharacterized protein V1510DRAFT_415371 [Dipodascopsis tothii]|uniref:uncharacterized protein n=1 Tax=Dipodascopsis tothii TaxID=44089 RepID=UPI0034CF5437
MHLQSVASIAASVAAAVLTLAPTVSAAAPHPAAVFAFPKPEKAGHHDIPSLRPAEARLGFAERLDVSRFHKLGYQVSGWAGGADKQGQDMKVLELDHFSGRHSGLWRDSEENIVVIVSGVRDTKDIFPESRPVFFISETPDAESFRELAAGFIQEAQQLSGDLSARAYTNEAEGFVSLVPDMDLCVPAHNQILSRSQCVVPAASTDADLVKDFVASFGDEFASLFDVSVKADSLFMDEAIAFNYFIEEFQQAVTANNQLAVLFFNSLNSMFVKYGADSVQYNAARALFAKLLQKLTLETAPSVPVTAVLLPGGNAPAPAKKAKRAAGEAFGNKHVSPSIPVSIMAESVCYQSQDECEIFTNFCSGGHGQCMQLYGQDGCFSCSCMSTYDETTRQRTYWAGEYCQKIDVTTPFQIFFWFLIVSLLFLAWTIKAMMSIGKEELPPVLAAATMVQAKQN